MAPVFGRLEYDLALSRVNDLLPQSKQSNVVHHIHCSCGHARQHWGNPTENGNKNVSTPGCKSQEMKEKSVIVEQEWENHNLSIN